jgi:hypothetical protein
MSPEQDEIGKGTTATVEKETTAQETTPEITPEEKAIQEKVITLTEKELDNRINAGKSELGRKLKSAELTNSTLKQQLDGYGVKLKELETFVSTTKQRERDAELNAAQGNSGTIDLIRLKHQNEDMKEALTRERSEFDNEKSQHQQRLERLAKTEATELAKELAVTSNLTEALLLDIATDSNNGTTSYNLDRMRMVASKNPKGDGAKPETDETTDETTPQTRGMQAKAGGSGGGRKGSVTMQDVDKAYAKGDISPEEYKVAAKKFGVQL